MTQTEPLDQDIEVAAALASAVSSLREAGFEVHDVQLPVSLRENWLYFQQLLFMRETRRGPDLARSIADLVPPPALESEPLEIALWAAGAGEDERRRIRTVRAAYRKAWSRFFSDYSALLLPVMQVAVLAPRDERVPVLADTIVVAGETQPMFSLSMWCALASFSGLPAVSLPVGRTSSGSPIGAQLVAGRGQDSDLLDLVVDVAKLVGQ